jgi:hypothetical protein
MRQVNGQLRRVYSENQIWQEHLPPPPLGSKRNLCLLKSALDIPAAERRMLLGMWERRINPVEGVPSFPTNRNLVYAAVRQNGSTLRFASTALKGDKSVVLEAVRQDGSTLQYA